MPDINELRKLHEAAIPAIWRTNWINTTKEQPESYVVQMEVETERWEIELGEFPAKHLAACRLGDSVAFLLTDVVPYLYQTDERFRQAVRSEGIQP